MIGPTARDYLLVCTRSLCCQVPLKDNHELKEAPTDSPDADALIKVRSKDRQNANVPATPSMRRGHADLEPALGQTQES